VESSSSHAMATDNAFMEDVQRGSKLIFTIFLHAHSPESFARLREARLKKMYSTPKSRERYRDEFNRSHPSSHRYNGVTGYAECIGMAEPES